MARPKKQNTTEDKPAKGVKYSEVKPEKGMLVNQKKYLLFLDIYHYLRPYLNREIQITKSEIHKRFPTDKQLVEDVWSCVIDLKLVWPQEMMGRLFSQVEEIKENE